MFTPPMAPTTLRVPKHDGKMPRHPRGFDCERLRPHLQAPNHTMSDGARRLGLRLVGVGDLFATDSQTERARHRLPDRVRLT